MTLSTLPVEPHLDRLLAFARVAPSPAAYEPIARADGLEVVRDADLPECTLLFGDAFALMLVDGQLARVHCVSLVEDHDGSDAATRVGIVTTDDCDVLAGAFAHLLRELERRLGAPTKAGQWRSTCRLHEEEHEYRYAAWSFDESTLALLLDEEGDGHIGELAALDLRLAPRSAEAGLPDSVRGPFAWPVVPAHHV